MLLPDSQDLWFPFRRKESMARYLLWMELSKVEEQMQPTDRAELLEDHQTLSSPVGFDLRRGCEPAQTAPQWCFRGAMAPLKHQA